MEALPPTPAPKPSTGDLSLYWMSSDTLGAHDLLSPPAESEVSDLLAQWTAPALIDHLLADASGGSYRIRRREALHQLMNLLPSLPSAQQVDALRRLRKLAGRAVYNLHVCT